MDYKQLKKKTLPKALQREEKVCAIEPGGSLHFGVLFVLVIPFVLGARPCLSAQGGECSRASRGVKLMRFELEPAGDDL